MSQNVNWDPETGAPCPTCGAKKAPVKSSMPREGGLKVRHHRCRGCGERFKSIEVVSAGFSDNDEIKQGLRRLDEAFGVVRRELLSLMKILNHS
jgi:hypothetical protein